MAKLHDLIRDHGKEQALRAEADPDVVEAAAAYMGDEAGRISCCYAGWCIAHLPHKAIPDDQVWEVRSGDVRLLVQPGSCIEDNGPPRPVGVPYGAKARLILLYLQTESLRTNSPEVPLGKSLNAWMRRMNIAVGGPNAAMVRNQAERLAACVLSFRIHQQTGGVGMVNQVLLDASVFTPDMGHGGRLFADRARLSEGFFKQLKKHPVPVEDSAISALANNSMALDVYVWLAYRLHALSAPTPLTWAAAKNQFGMGVGRLDHFRRLFSKSLRLALAVYPAAHVDVTDTGLLLHPSRAPVMPRLFVARNMAVA